jgi:hypothetical protein
MRFIKHVGKHGDRKVAVVFRQLPGEEHMCLVIYTELLNQNVHDPLIQCIESDIGQSSDSLADALNRSYTKDGQIILQVLHREGMLKKVQTSTVMMTPSPNQHIKLSELNTILDEMSKGEEAVRKLADIDASRGLQDPKDVARRIREQKSANGVKNQSSDALGNSDLASNLRAQAAKMAAEAKGLMAESERLLTEAVALEPVVKETVTSEKKTRTKKSVAVEPVVQATAAKKSGRPRKTAVAG